MSELQLACKRDILDVFAPQRTLKVKGEDAYYFKSDGFTHYILAEHGSEAKKCK